jgi:electron transfer flavoprotein beta subunit
VTIAVVLRRNRGGDRRLGDCERAALSAALGLGAALGHEVEAFALGGPRDDAALELALRAGCSRATRIDDRGVRRIDYLATARVLSLALARPAASLILCGADSGDGHGGAVGPALAQWLELPHLGGVVDARPSGDRLEVVRRQGGELHRYQVPLPVVLCVARFPAVSLPPVRHRGRPTVLDLSSLDLERDELEARARGSGTPTRRTPPRAELVASPAALLDKLVADGLLDPPVLAAAAAPHRVSR